MWQDAIVEEVRKVRIKHAEQFDFDLKAIYQDLKKKEQEGEREVVSFPPKRIRPVETEPHTLLSEA